MNKRWVLLVALAAACAEERGAGAEEGAAFPVPASLPAVVPQATFVDALRAWRCAAYFRCPGYPREVTQLMGSYARCVARAESLPNQQDLTRLLRLAAAGVVRYDGAVARRCLDAARGLGCDGPTPAVCDAVFRGDVPLGGACVASEACAGDTFCGADERGARVCAGRCRQRPARGEACPDPTFPCSQAEGPTACSYDPTRDDGLGVFRCAAVGPRVALADGAACGPDAPAESRGLACASGSECWVLEDPSGPFAQPRTACQRLPVMGEPCESQCADGTTCVFAPGAPRGRCTATAVRDREGESCVQGNLGAEVCNVTLGLDCVQGRCQRVGTGAEGSVCFTGPWRMSNCAPGLQCDDATGVCGARKADGARCAQSDECASGTCGYFSDDGLARCGLAPNCG